MKRRSSVAARPIGIGVVVIVAVALGLAGCGQKGPLVLPAASALPATATGAASAPPGTASSAPGG